VGEVAKVDSMLPPGSLGQGDEDIRRADAIRNAITAFTRLPGFHKADTKMRRRTEPMIVEMESMALPKIRAFEWFDAHAECYLPLVTDQHSWETYRILLYELWYPKAYEYLYGDVRVRPVAEEGLKLARRLDGQLRHWHTAASEALAVSREQATEVTQAPDLAGQDSPVTGTLSLEIVKEALTHLPELPPKFQNAFEAAKANAELEQAKLARSPHQPLYEIGRIKLIQDVFFAYCTQARAACRPGNITVAQARQAAEAALHSISDLYFDRDHGTLSNDAKLTFRGHFTQGVTNDPQWHQHLLELAELAEDSAKEPTETASQRSGSLSFRLNDWQDLEIRFLSDERIHLNVGECSETRNYAEFGFEDRRTKKPNLAWVTLRALAQKEGIIKQAVNGQDWRSVEKRIQEIRRLFRKHFELDADPIPFVDGLGYKASFKINCAPSFES
jgi:hypothetical protein